MAEEKKNPWDLAQYFTPTNLLAGAGAIGNYFSGKSAAKSQKELNRAQRRILDMQGQTYKQAQPGYQALLASYQQAAGLDPNHHVLAPTSGSQMGNAWGQPEDQMRFAAAQDQISKLAQQRQNQLQHNLAARGVASSSIGAALAQNQRSALQDLAGFRRQLAIDAPHEQERRRNALLAALGPAFGQGAQASAGYGNQAQQYGQEANNAYSALGQGLQNYGYQRALAGYGQQPGAGESPYAAPGGMPYGNLGQDYYIDEYGQIQYR